MVLRPSGVRAVSVAQLVVRLRGWQLNACEKDIAIQGDEKDGRKGIRMAMEVMR